MRVLKLNDSLRSKTSNKLHVPAAHHKSLRFIGSKIWNSLSDKARKATTLNEYMREYKNENTKEIDFITDLYFVPAIVL